jgi:transposase
MEQRLSLPQPLWPNAEFSNGWSKRQQAPPSVTNSRSSTRPTSRFIKDACHFSQNAEQQGFGKTKGGRNSKLNVATNGKGKLLNLKLVPGNESDMKSATEVFGEVRDLVVLADRGYDSDAIREYISSHGGAPNIPGRKNRTTAPFYLKELGKRRHVVENFFVRIKRFRRVNTRYDRSADTCLSFVFLAALMDWVR